MPLIEQFTPTTLRTLPEGTWREEASPLILRVRRASRSYCIEYSRRGQPTRYLIGRVGEIELGSTSLRGMDKRTDARALARKARAAVTAGGDPHREHMAATRQRDLEARAAEVDTVRATLELYLQTAVKRDGSPMDPAAVATARRIFELHVYPEFGSTRPEELERHRINEHLRSIAKRTPTRARHVLSAWRRAFSWAENEGRLRDNPLLRLPAPAPNVERDRVLDDSEIKLLWEAMDARRARREAGHQRPSIVAYALKLSLLTGLRMGAVAGARWAEVREEQPGEWWWTVPSSRTKTRKADHRVFVTPQARAIFDLMRPMTGGREQVFHSDSKTGSMTAWGASWADFLADARAQAREAGDERAFAERTTPHDLRRTAASHISQMYEDEGTSRFIVKKILGHVDGGGVTGVYDRNRYDRTRKRVLLAWNTEMERIIEGTVASHKVIAFQAGA